MVVRIIVALIVILAILQGLVDAVPENIVSIALVILGLVYGGMALDAEDATSFLVVAIAVGAAAGADVLSNIPGILGESLDAIVDPITIALYAGVITVFAKRAWNRISASGDGGGEE